MKTHARKVDGFWARYAGSVAFILLIVIAAIGFARVENARYESCTAGNALRAGLRTAEEERLAANRALDPNVLFPDIAPSVYAQLLKEKEEEVQHRVTTLYVDRPCGTHIDVPLTGASITFPP